MSTIFGAFAAVPSGFGSVNWEISCFDFTIASGHTLTVDNLLAFFPSSGGTIGSSTAKTVTIWNTSGGTVAAQGTVTTGTALYSGTQAQAVSITPVTLNPGTYRVSCGNFATDGCASNGSGPPNPNLTFNLPSGVTIDSTYTQYYNSSPATYPNTAIDSIDQYLTGSFTYTSGGGGGASLAWSPTTSTAVDNSTTASSTITLTGSSNAINLTLAGAGSLSTTTPASGASIVYTPPPSESGSATVTAAVSGVTSQVWTITYGPASPATFTGGLTLTSNTRRGGITFTFAAGTGTGTLTYGLRRSTSPIFLASDGTQVASGTGLSLTDPTPGSAFVYYLATVTDSNGTVGVSAQWPGQQVYFAVQPVVYDVKITWGGDSHTVGVGVSTSQRFANLATSQLAEALPDCSFTSVVEGVAGTTSADWVNNTNGAVLSTVTGQYDGSYDLNLAPWMLGTNDDQDGNQFSQATYQANMLTIANACKTAGQKPILACPPINMQDNAAWTNTSVTSRLQLYRAALANIADNSTIFAELDTFNALATQYQNKVGTVVGDGTHFGVDGHVIVANYFTAQINRVIQQIRGIYGLSTSGGGGSATSYQVKGIPAAPVVGESYPVTIVLNGQASASMVATFGSLSGITWGGTVSIASGSTSGSTSVTFTSAGTYTPTITHTGGGFSGDPTLSSSTASAGALTLAQLESALASGITTLAPNSLDGIVVETGLNARQALSLAAADAAGSLATDGSGNVTIKGAGVSTTRISATTSGNNRTCTISPPM